jgi:hypothetical protein
MKFFVQCLLAVLILSAAQAAFATTYLYTPPASGTNPRLWSDPTQWTPTGIPGSGDTVVISFNPNPGNSVALEADGVIVKNLQVSWVTGGGALVGTGFSIETGGTFEWQSGYLSGLTATIPAGATLTIDTASPHFLDGSTLNNASTTATWTAGSLNGDGDAVFNNTGTLTISTGAWFDYGAGVNNCDFYNPGKLVITGTGTVNNPTGVWGFHNTGTVNVGAGAVFEWQTSSNTQHTLDDGGTLTGAGTLLFDEPSSTSPNSVLTINGTTTVASGATLSFGPGAMVSAGASNGTLQGPGTLLWVGGQIAGDAMGKGGRLLTWGSTLQVHMTGAALKDLSTAYVVANGPITWDQGIFGGGGGSYLVNNAAFSVAGDLTSTSGYNSTLENRGTLTKTAGTGTFTVNGLSIDNFGTVSAAKGNILLVTASNGALQSQALEAGSTLQGSIVATCPVSLVGDSTVAAGSTLELGNDGTNASTLTGSGTLGGAGTVKIDGSSISAGPMQAITFGSTGKVVLAANAASTYLFVDAMGSVTFAGTTSLTGGTVEVGLGTATNSGSFTASGVATMTNGGSSCNFANTGTFTVDPGAGKTVTMDLDGYLNSGTTILKSGTALFDLGNEYVQTAGATTLAGGTLAAHDTSMPPNVWTVDIQGGTLGGSGTVDGIVTNEGTVAPGTSTAAGTLTITGAYTQSSTGTLAIGLGGTTAGTQFDVLASGDVVTLAGSLVVTRIGAYVPDVGNTYKVLTSAAPSPGVSGTFGTVTQPTGVTLTTTYDPGDVTLGVTAVNIPDGGTDAGMDASVVDSGTPGDSGGPVDEAGMPEAAAGDAGEDAGFSVDAAGSDGGSPPNEPGKAMCSCHTVGGGDTSSAVGAAGVLLGIAAAFARRRVKGR